MELSTILAPIDRDLEQVNTIIRRALHSPVAMIDEMSEYIISSGGKRLRPAVLILAARACGYEADEHLLLAAATEIVHTATLLHDDVVDASELRRGRRTANAIWGNEASVIVGDYLYSRATQLLVETQRMDIIAAVSSAANGIAEGEILQMTYAHNAGISEEAYFDIIRNKTARLFEASTQVGAMIATAPEQLENALARYGMHLGNAFQLIDDVLDYQGDVEEIGKNIGDDLADGKTTLPLIYALRQADDKARAEIRRAIEDGDATQLPLILSAIESSGAIEYTLAFAAEEADRALNELSTLPSTPFSEALANLVTFSVERRY